MPRDLESNVFMRIIENNQKEHECICWSCKSKLAYVQSDIRFKCDEYFGELHSHTYLICPVCKKKIILEVY